MTRATVQIERTGAAVVSSRGASVDADSRARLEGRLGHDFGAARVDDDQAVAESVQGLGALDHELVHAAQQRFAEPPARGSLAVSSPADATEREAAAVAAGATAAPPAHAPATGTRPATEDQQPFAEQEQWWL